MGNSCECLFLKVITMKYLWILCILWVVVAAVLLLSYVSYQFLLRCIKRGYYKRAPKVVVIVCDKGHYFPEDAALTLEDIPGCTSPVKLCPVCFDENLKRAEAQALNDVAEVRKGNGKKTRGTITTIDKKN